MTAFENINALKPAYYLIVKNGTSFFKKYWDIPTDTPLLNYKQEQDYVEHFQEVFQIAVADRIRTSSIVISLSGGMDSTTIAATVDHIRRKKAFSVHAITAIHEQLISDNERYYADLAAKRLHIPIQFINGDKFPMIRSEFITTSPMQLISPDFWFDAVWSEYDRAVCDGAMLPEGVTTGDIESIRAAFREGLSEFVKRYMKEES